MGERAKEVPLHSVVSTQQVCRSPSLLTDLNYVDSKRERSRNLLSELKVCSY